MKKIQDLKIATLDEDGFIDLVAKLSAPFLGSTEQNKPEPLANKEKKIIEPKSSVAQTSKDVSLPSKITSNIQSASSLAISSTENTKTVAAAGG